MSGGLVRVYDSLPGPLQTVAAKAYYAFGWRVFPQSGLLTGASEENLVEQFFNSEAELRRYEAEFDDGPIAGLFEQVEAGEIDGFDSAMELGSLTEEGYRRCYAILRSVEPETIVETGVLNGMSTRCFLTALERNGTGRLYSIDYPEDDRLPADEEPGWLVPDDLRERWELRLGRSQRELPALLAELEAIDCFVHDSDHSAPCMQFEFEAAWEYMERPGLILSDAIYMSTGFWDFADTRADISGHVTPQVGYAVKEREC